MPKQGDIATCSRGQIGLITCERPVIVTYEDGTIGEAWTGIHLGGAGAPVMGSPWCSRNPNVLYNITALIMEKIGEDIQ